MSEDYKKYYDLYKVEGTFVLYQQKSNKYIVYNKELSKQLFIPASTFKICNSLIGLETGVIDDENFIIKWDSIIRKYPQWNTDQNLETAFKNSTVWYYQELARRVGAKQMKYWLEKSHYGNADTSGGIDQFWLTGGLRISPIQQVDFLRRLHDNQLPFSNSSMNIVKEIMIVKDSADYVLRAKSGWGEQNNMDIGWYVGYVETQGDVYYFANCIQSPSNTNSDFLKARIEITYQIFRDLGIFKD
ncbi:MAG: class D beta-lactamase [Chitinophagales bacterium]|nr:class D beta-lactamase [Chitinophagales bacterium]